MHAIVSFDYAGVPLIPLLLYVTIAVVNQAPPIQHPHDVCDCIIDMLHCDDSQTVTHGERHRTNCKLVDAGVTAPIRKPLTTAGPVLLPCLLPPPTTGPTTLV